MRGGSPARARILNGFLFATPRVRLVVLVHACTGERLTFPIADQCLACEDTESSRGRSTGSRSLVRTSGRPGERAWPGCCWAASPACRFLALCRGMRLRSRLERRQPRRRIGLRRSGRLGGAGGHRLAGALRFSKRSGLDAGGRRPPRGTRTASPRRKVHGASCFRLTCRGCFTRRCRV